MSRRIFITVAEVSGDKHAAQLIRELRKLDPEIVIEGVGGPEMVAAGATIHRNTVTKAAMGWRGILRAGDVYGLLRWTRNYFDQHRPDLWIGVDSPSMNFHFARAAHDRGIPSLQFVAPQLWAWAPWRMKKLRKWVDQVACILPFEEEFFRGHGVNATFVGHPLFDELPPRKVIPVEERFPSRPPVVGLLAGSRKSEAQGNFPGMLGAAKRIAAEFPGASFLVPTTAGTQPVVQSILQTSASQGFVSFEGLAIEFGRDRFDEMVPRCDLCLTVSGTATLHVASFGVPMVVVYHISRLAWNVVGRWLVPTRTFALVNVLAKRAAGNSMPGEGHIVPEIIPWTSVDPLADYAIDLLRHPEKLESQRNDLARLIAPLDHPGASLNTAKVAIQMMERRA
jgi:lipid-A-disaccharide synthase